MLKNGIKNNKTTIVLLPGMDGTGNLFTPLLNELGDYGCKVMTLPQTGPQDYPTLTQAVRNHLPQGDFILIAESFSGPIAARLAQENIPSLQGTIFIATFLLPPKKLLVKMAQHLPIKWINQLPGAQYFQKKLFFNKNVTPEILKQFNDIITSIPVKVLKNRLKAIQTLKPNKYTNSQPCLYISAAQDKLVATKHINAFHKIFQQLTTETINGPHFITQTEPQQCSRAITNFIKKLNLSH